MNTESQNIEFKETWKDEYLKWICGFANAQGGKICIGIRDDGSVCGVNNAKKLLEDIPKLKVYDDRLVLWNEGELPMGYTVETLLSEHSSRPRNKNIATVFYLAGFIETWGRGFDKIRNGFASANLPMPLFESKFGGLQVTIQRPEGTSKGTSNSTSKGTSNSTSKGTSNSTSNSTSNQVLRLIKILTEDMSIQRMMNELGFTSRPRFIENYLNPATSGGYVEMTQPNSPKSPTQKYRLTEKGIELLNSNTSK